MKKKNPSISPFSLIISCVGVPMQEKMERERRRNVTLKTAKKESFQMKMKTIPSCDKNPRLSAGWAVLLAFIALILRISEF